MIILIIVFRQFTAVPPYLNSLYNQMMFIMVMSMSTSMLFKYTTLMPLSLKCSLYLCSFLLLVACQPSTPSDGLTESKNQENVDSPAIIGTDSVTVSQDHILNIKPSRYQPSLGLRGNIEPIRHTQFTVANQLIVEKVMISEGQLVEEGTPLLVVSSHSAVSTNNAANQLDVANQSDNLTSPNPTENADKDASDNTVSKDIAATRKTNAAIDSAIGNEAAIGNPNSPVNASQITQYSRNVQNPEAPLVIRASFSGRVDSLYVEVGDSVAAGEPLLSMSDKTNLHFLSTLPIKAKSQLSVGQTVSFTAGNLLDKFAGQVSKLRTDKQAGKLLVYVNVIDNETNRNALTPNMAVMGRVDYGQIEVGTIVPKHALHNVDLSELQRPPHQPLDPLTAEVWIIKQDQRLARQVVEVVKYDPSTEQYLIAGISNDSLICLADLPKDSVGKKVIVS